MSRRTAILLQEYGSHWTYGLVDNQFFFDHMVPTLTATPYPAMAHPRAPLRATAATGVRAHLVTAANIKFDGGARNEFDPDNGYKEAYKKIWRVK
jgi:hypothetical protein